MLTIQLKKEEKQKKGKLKMNKERAMEILYNAISMLSEIYDDSELVEELGIDFGELEEM